MKFVPVIGKILADLAIRGTTNPTYRELIKPMNINRGILVDEKCTVAKKAQQPVKVSSMGRAAIFNKIWN